MNVSGSLHVTALFYLASPLWVSGTVGQDRTWTNICLISSSPWPRSGTPQELPQAHSTFPEPSEGQMESPGAEITRPELKVTQGSLAGGWTWKWEGRDVRGSVHSFCSPTLVVSVESQYFPVSEVAINSVLHVPVLSKALRVDTYCNTPDCQSQA